MRSLRLCGEMDKSTEWVRFGWQGISGLAPAEWNLGAIGGEYKQGYLRLDDAERPRLELKWSSQQVEISQALERYLRSLGKTRRGAPRMEIDQEVKILSRRAKPSKRMLGFSWRQGESLSGAGLIWACETCGRVLISQVRAYGKEDAIALAKQVLESLEDHGREGKLLWALYGLDFEAPEEYALTGQSLLAGYLELRLQKPTKRFQRGEPEGLRICRWGLAETVLATTSLRDWGESAEALGKGLYPSAARDTIIRGHPGLEIDGESRRLLRRLKRGVVGMLRGSAEAGAPEARGRLWHCPPSNRIYLVEMLSSQTTEALDGVVESLRCHIPVVS